MTIQTRTALCSAFVLLALTACGAKDGNPSGAKKADDSPVAATVNGTPIRKSTIDMIVKQQAAQGMPDTPDTRKMIIENLSMQMLVAEEGVKKGLDKSPEVAQQLDLTRQSILANAFVADYLKNTPITDDALKAEYEKFKGQTGGTQYKAKHILVASETEAKDIIAKLNKDVKVFEALAKEKSNDPGSKTQGGELGWFDKANMVPEFGDAVAKLGKGKFTETPVKTQYGFHVILLEDTRENPVPPFDQVKTNLKQQVSQQNLKKLVDDLKAKARIDIIAAPASTAAASASAAAASK